MSAFLLSSSGYGDCAAGYLCLWEHGNFAGRRLQFQAAALRNLTDFGFNDQMSSWRNRRYGDARWYGDVNRGGPSLCMNGGAAAASIGPYNDTASSIQLYNSALACR